MINFNFTVDDVDAEMIMGAMQDKIANAHLTIQRFMVEGDKEAEIAWMYEHIEYLKDLMSRMDNTRVDDD